MILNVTKCSNTDSFENRWYKNLILDIKISYFYFFKFYLFFWFERLWTRKEVNDNIGAFTEVTSSASSNGISSVWTYKWNVVLILSHAWEFNLYDTEIQLRCLHPVYYFWKTSNFEVSKGLHCIPLSFWLYEWLPNSFLPLLQSREETD